jgi:hypothetical protein
MKQIKVIADDYNASSGGLLNANFNENLEIKPYSKIVLDKFMIVLNNDTQGYIEIPNQTLKYSPQFTTTVKAQPVRTIVIPAGRYNYNTNASSGIIYNDLLNTISELLNGSLDASPLVSTLSTDPTADLGLGFKLSTDVKGLTNIECYQCPLNQQGNIIAPSVPPSLVNMGQVSNNGYEPGIVGNFSLYVPTPIIQGGLQAKVQLRVGDDDFGTYYFGLAYTPALITTPPDISFGIKVDGNDNKIYFHNPDGDVECPFTKADLLTANPNNTLGAQFYFYTANNKLQLLIYNSDGVTVFFNSATSNNGAYNDVYSGFLFADICHLAVKGQAVASSGLYPIFRNISLTEQPNLAFDNVGFYQDISSNRNYITANGLGAIPARAIHFDFSDCPILQEGLGFTNKVLNGNTNVGTGYFLFLSDNAINFSQFLDLAIETLNIPLQTYISKTNGIDCGKRNVLAYFTPQRVSQNQSIYVFENKNLTFLSINNQESMNMSSIQFRLYNPQSNKLTINAEYLSFNVYIGDKDEN